MLRGVRIRKYDDDDNERTVVEYRLRGGAVEVGGGGEGMDHEVELDNVDNAVIEEVGRRTGVRIAPFAEGAAKTYGPKDGAEFLAAVLVRYDRAGQSWAEEIND
jgi:hypothetical protein